MLQTVKQWLTPPIFEQDEARTNAAQVLHFISWILLVTSMAALGFFSTTDYERERIVFTIITVITLSIFSMWRLRLGNVYFVGWVYLVFLWSLSLQLSLSTRGILSPYPVLQITVILLSAVILKPVYAVYFSLASVASNTVLLLVSMEIDEVSRFYSDETYVVYAVSNWIAYGLGDLITAGIVMYTTRLIRQNINNIRENEQELAARNKEFQAEIIQRELIEAELRQSERKFRMLTEMALAGIYILQGTPVPTFVYVNEALARMLGYTPDEIVGKLTLADFVPPDQLKLASERIRQRLDGSSTAASNTYIAFRRDGSQFPLEVSSTAIEFQGKPALVGTVIDLTSVRQAEQVRIELEVERQRIQFLQDFVDTMTHDLKNPLTVINTSLFLVKNSKDPASHEANLNRIDTQVEHMMAMVEQMLTVARLDSIPNLNLVDTDINHIIEQVRDQQITKAERKRLTISCELAPDVDKVPADSDQFYHAATNLIANAINYTPENGTITIRTRRTSAEVIMEVTDTGIGINRDDLPHIFERFYRAKNAEGLPGGSGLGLAIVKRIVNLHQGQIDVTSTPGEGTTFRIRFPAATSTSGARTE